MKSKKRYLIKSDEKEYVFFEKNYTIRNNKQSIDNHSEM